MQAKPIFIDDGYTETVDLEYGVSLKYRPCVGTARAEFFDSLETDAEGNVSPVEYRKQSNKLLAEYALEIGKEKGPFTPEQLDKVPDDLFEEIRVVVLRVSGKAAEREADDSKN